MGTFLRLRTINIGFLILAVVTVVFFLVGGSTGGIFSGSGFMPHGHCYLWNPGLVATMVTTDLLIGLAYVSISLCLYVLVRRIRLPFSAMFLAFGLFIAACGATHFMEVFTLWYPSYWVAAFVKVITALASVATALIMFPLFPKVVEFAASARLSEQRKKQLEVLNEELEARTRELTAVNRELEAFSYSVSHDLRSPLRGIDGFCKALAEDYGDKFDARGQEYLGYVRSGAQRMGQIIDDLLNLARVTRHEINPQRVDLSEAARQTLHDLRKKDGNRNVEVFVQAGMFDKGDAGQLRIVYDNLLGNAWKFTSKAVGARIEVGMTNDANGPVYFVRDNGVGFDMRFVDKLFGPFQRLHNEDDYPGTGIGLATAKRIIDRHHGTIRVESVPGKGTTFYFTLGD